MGLHEDYDDQSFSDYGYEEDEMEDIDNKRKIRKRLEEKLERKRLKEEFRDEFDEWDDTFDWSDVER